MQPYFFPYAGYFRLFAECDEFILYDCVQFPRRGRVHRTQVIGPGGHVEWLTLPLARQPVSILIRDLAFAPDARQVMDRRLLRVAGLAEPRTDAAEQVIEYLHAPLGSVIDYLETGLRLVTRILGLDIPIHRSSSLGVDSSLRGQERVLAIARARGASTYVNSPGGQLLYDPDRFARHGITLAFLPDYRGAFFQLLPALLMEPAGEIRDDVIRTSREPGSDMGVVDPAG